MIRKLVDWYRIRKLRRLGIEYLGGWCPVQAAGEVDGQEIYFRSRGNSWTFGIGRDPFLDVGTVFNVKGNYGTFPEAGYLPWNKTYKILITCMKLYELSKIQEGDVPHFKKERNKSDT